MRGLLRAGTIALLIVIAPSVDAQLGPPPSQAQEIQKTVNDAAEKHGQEIADRARGTALGLLNLDANRAITRWDLAVRAWKKEKGAGAAPLLAAGVLLDCLGRLQGVYTRPVGLEESRPFWDDQTAARPGLAAKAFDAALKLDPSLVEARLRAARIRAVKDSRAALELERLAGGPSDSPLSYLAAMIRAEAAQARRDGPAEIRWYERALQLHPGSTAATLALGGLNASGVTPFDGLDPADPYYTYPCTVLTPAVAEALSARMQKVVVK